MHPLQTLGVAEMDRDHAEFLTLLEQLGTADEETFAVLFQKLVDHVRMHFITEGRFMRQVKFPALGEHEGEHHRVMGELLQFNRNVKRGRLPLARAYVRSGLPQWFALHFSTMDSALAAHIKRHQLESDALEALPA